MKVLALEVEKKGLSKENFKPFLEQEAAMFWEFKQKDIIREIYFNANTHCAVIILEAPSDSHASEILKHLPLVRKGLIDFDLIPLSPYDGFSRLFREPFL